MASLSSRSSRNASLATLAAVATFCVAPSVRAATVDATAPVASLDLASSATQGMPPRVAYAALADRYLVVWTTVEHGPVRGAVLDSSGKVVVPTFDVAPEGSCASVASNGRDFAVARRNEAILGGEGPVTRVVHATGVVDPEIVLAGGPKGTAPGAPPRMNTCPVIAWDGAAYRIAWADLDGSPLGLATYAPPAAPKVETGFVVPTQVRGLACAGETCLISSPAVHADQAPQNIAIWTRGETAQPRVNVDPSASMPIYRSGAFDFARFRLAAGSSFVHDAAEIATLDLADPRLAQGTGKTSLELEFSQTIPLANASFPAHDLADWASLFAWETHDGQVPTHGSVQFSADVTGPTAVPVLPIVDDLTTYRAIALQAGPRGRALVVASRGRNGDPPYEVVARALTIDGLPAPSDGDGGAGADGGGRAGGGAESSSSGAASSPSTSTSSSGCGCRSTAAASPTLATLASALVLGLLVHRRRASRSSATIVKR